MASDIRTMQQIPLDQIVPSPFQTRKDFDPEQLQGLAKTMQQHGLMNPICVRPVGKKFELIAGERRCRAAKLLGWKTIEARVDVVDDQEAAQRVVVENLQRDGDGVWIRAYWSESREKLDPYLKRLKAAVLLWVDEQLSDKIDRQNAGTDQMTDADYARKIALDNDPDVAAAYFARELRKREKASERR